MREGKNKNPIPVYAGLILLTFFAVPNLFHPQNFFLICLVLFHLEM